MNVVNLIGRLIADPEIKKTQKGISLCTFTISVQRPGGAKDENGYYKSDLIRCEAWRNTADFIPRYFYKGDMIRVNGSIQVEPYTDKNGNKTSFTKVVINNVYFCGGKKEGSQRPAQQADPRTFSTAALDFEPVNDDGDLPF